LAPAPPSPASPPAEPAPSTDPSNDGSRAVPPRAKTPASHQLIERQKELEHAHLAMLGRHELPSAPRLMLSLRFVRTALASLLSRPGRARPLPVPTPAPGAVALTMVGHATVMLTTPRTRILTDPCFAHWLWGLRRVEPVVIDPADLAKIDLVLISHAHQDHLHLPSLRRLPRSATVLAPAGCLDLIEPLGFSNLRGLEPGGAHVFRDVTVTALPARHDGRRSPFDPRWRGALGFLIKTADVTAYYAGDTGYFSGFADLGRRFRPDVALLPIAGYLPLPQRIEHMSPLDAIAAFEELGARLLVPIGHRAFALGYEDLEAPAAWLRELAAQRGYGDRVRTLAAGETCLVRRT
jgi:L-ascorbate metabolism protein UlaG (beta-lactamase superfamily)